MSNRCRPLAMLTTLLLLAGVAPGMAQTVQQPDTVGAAAAPYTPTMGDLMNAFVQPRHAKLGLAGKAGNWALAAYAVVEIRQTFSGIVKAQPRFRGYPVGELVDAALAEPLRAVEAAIKQRDPRKFAAAYDQLSRGCNACHASLDHAFVVIKAPGASAFPNQDFTPGQ